eukprot:gb/GECG01010464.1/.p1 GENE.gb/GECG01010464.1/~~gb/GECG01010464.1/.p1  ORF type:complete len:221 (+),score=35.11 gb/GECG01010464.1/:1-663(+)
MEQQNESEINLSLRQIDKQIHELRQELKTMQGYMYKLKNQHRRTLYFRASANAYKSCLRTVKATESLSANAKEAETTMQTQGQQSKNALNALYKEAFKRLHLAARHLGTEMGSVRFVRETLALLTCVASIGERLKRCGRWLGKIERVTLDASLAASLASTIIVGNKPHPVSEDQPSEPTKKSKKRKKRQRESESDNPYRGAVVNSEAASLLQSGGWDLLK